MAGSNEGRFWAVVEVLERPLYSISEAARLLEIAPQTLRRWLEGASVKGTLYPPVLRTKPTGQDVTWAEFVEAGLLREYRGRLSLQYLRGFIDERRDQYGTPYPLAHYRPVVDLSRRELLTESAVETELETHKTRQMMWAQAAESFLEKVEFDPSEVAARMYPLGKAIGVVIDPEVTFGIPTIEGIRTETLFEAFSAGETLQELEREYDIKQERIERTVQWESRLARKAA